MDGSVASAAGVKQAQVRKDLIVTYRVLRFGIVLAVFMLVSAVVIEIARTGSVRGSISAYFYSPARSVFVGTLVALGLALVAIRGSTKWEELWLNLAGLFAPVVAFVPVAPSDDCPTVISASRAETTEAGSPFPPSLMDDVQRDWNMKCYGAKESGLPDWVVLNIKNNMLALLLTGLLALVIMGVLMSKRRGTPEDRDSVKWNLKTLVVYIVLLAFGVVLYVLFEGKASTSHYAAAIAMFVFFGFVALINSRDAQTPQRYRNIYTWVWVLMLLAALLCGAYIGLVALGVPDWGKQVFALEMAEIVLFGLFWLAQTVQLWNKADTT